MSTKGRWVAVIGALLVVATIVTMQKSEDAQHPVDIQRVARKYTAALGGWDRVKNVRTREVEGTFEYEGVEQYATGHVEMRWRAPASLVEQLRGPMGVVTRGFDGVRGWGSHPQTGVRQLSSFEIDELLLDGVLYQPLGVHHRYGEPKYEGRTKIGGRETEVLSALRHGGKTDRFYFDVVTGLPIRLDVWEEGPEAIRSGRSGDFYLAHYQLDDYRTIDGVTVPFFVRRQRPNSTMTFRFTAIRHNVALADSIFRVPVRSSRR